MKIQFICTGNTFRSRLAEAFLKSKKISKLEVTSSGIGADDNLNGPICSYTLSTAKENNIQKYLSKNWRVTNKPELEIQDKVIFMGNYQYLYCVNKLKANLINYEVWDIPDVYDVNKSPSQEELISTAGEIFKNIKTNVDRLELNVYL
jgi:protein-tyrosine-phosphatase